MIITTSPEMNGQAFIAGAYTAAVSGKTFDCISPVDGRVLTQVAACDVADVDLAVRVAREAMDDGRWCNLAPAVRKRTLLRFAELIEQHAEELALLETLDMGKPIRDSRAVDVPATVNCFRWYAEAIDKVYGEVAPTASNVLATITREPLGVCGIVVPWNFPLIMAAWKLAPALAAGNSIILKPAEQSPLTAIRLAGLALEAGIPAGVFNVVPGFGETAGRAIGLHMDIDGVFFTGSTAVGKLFMQYSGQSNLKKVGLECGGKTGHIILADCGDLDAAAEAAAYGIFFNQGEMCTAGSRLILDAPIKDAVLEKLTAFAATMQPGNPLDPETRLGAMVNHEHTQRVMEYIRLGNEEAELLIGGKQCEVVGGGCYIEPTIFHQVDNRMRIAQEEIFGPVLAVITVNGVDEAIRVANDSIYGLAAGVWSDNVNTLFKATRALKAGVVYANCYDADDITTPFGGYKQSGMGRDKSLHAFDKYTELKTTWLRLR
ncbi:aldehyde dehydrogenase [Thiothrix winogradskyi]|uniref:Aldehyde dehydrogenase n=1 Tax=Thiothrix winogradskyi TaxID=96472 RepID=A0ABY3SYP5_9GAMM|nr:aldehyde dehydrogenase [Thiothrix winogradskyi]UJS23870.1 aldehyde dehydrogenase [Thiothrix winogradskyi]